MRGRPKKFERSIEIKLKMECVEYEALKELAAYESMRLGRDIYVQALIRMAVRFTFSDNERLRECFRRTRFRESNRFRKKYY